jgi:hypothetical protein
MHSDDNMRLTVFSHKLCWPSDSSPSGFASHGGFPIQMKHLAALFDATTLVLPQASTAPERMGELVLTGHNLEVVPVTFPTGQGAGRKTRFPLWLLRNLPTLLREAQRADAIHAPIPGDIGTVGMFLALLWRKPLFVRHCGNWLQPKTIAENFWQWFMETFAGGRHVMLATGGAAHAPSVRNADLKWIFSTSLTEAEMAGYRHVRRLQDSTRLIIVCRQEKNKGTHLVIESLPLLKEQFPTISLDIVGDGAALPWFRQRAEELGVSDRIYFRGKVNHDQVMALLQQADLFCYPTMASEGFPKVVLEALASGLPVVTTRVSVLPQLLGAGGGVLLPAAKSEAIASAVAGILADPDRYHQLSQSAVETAQQYTLEAWQNMIGTNLRQSWGPLRTDV